MLYRDNEAIVVSPLVHSLTTARAVKTPGFHFENERLFEYQKPFLSAGVSGLGCPMCGLGSLTSYLPYVVVGGLIYWYLMKRR